MGVVVQMVRQPGPFPAWLRRPQMMAVRNFTTAEKLAVIENIIEHPADGDEVEVLKAIARDLRGRLNGQPSVCLAELDRFVVSTGRSTTPGRLIALGQETLRFWPTLKCALELFGARAEERVKVDG